MKSYLLSFALLFSNAAIAQEAAPTSDNMLAAANKAITHITAEQLQQQIKEQPETVVIDVRTQYEVRLLGTLGIYQNINIPRGWIEFDVGAAVESFDTPIVVYCGTNIRSPMAAQTLMEMGYTNVSNYDGGFFEWQELGLETNLSTLDANSLLYQRPEKVVEGVYSAIGAPAPSTYENSGHNNNLSFIVADDAVVVFNAGGSYMLAKAMHEEIKLVTDLPVKFVIYENAQGHAVFGGSYWKEQGVEIIAHENTPEILEHDKEKMMERTQRSLKDKFFKSHIVMPDRTFSDEYIVPVKGKKIVLKHFGHAHSPDDMQLWLPEDELLISGDFAFNERMLPVLEHTDMLAWQENWSKLEALNPKVIIPGHGGVTDLATVTHYTMGYVNYMVDEVMKVLDDGGELTDAYKIDQSAFMQWKTYRELSLRNAAELYKIAEFEW
ncbi:MAG TPA: sulfurtransferase [Oceanospirillaceae bacterium]|nr:sulfurtransferase [Oceanospirillaceae bacterium]